MENKAYYLAVRLDLRTIHHFHKRTESTLFTYPLLSLLQKHTIKMLIGLTFSCTGTVTKTNIFESVQLDLPPLPSILPVRDLRYSTLCLSHITATKLLNSVLYHDTEEN